MSIQSARAVTHPFLLLMQYLSALTPLLIISANSVFTPRWSAQLSCSCASQPSSCSQALSVPCTPIVPLFLWVLYFCNCLCFYVVGQQWWNKKWQPTPSLVMMLSFQFSSRWSQQKSSAALGHTKRLQHGGRSDLWAPDVAPTSGARGGSHCHLWPSVRGQGTAGQGFCSAQDPLSTAEPLELLLPAHPATFHCPVHEEWLWALPLAVSSSSSPACASQGMAESSSPGCELFPWLWALPLALSSSSSPASAWRAWPVPISSWTDTARPEEHMGCPMGTSSKPSQELRADTKHSCDSSPTSCTHLPTMGHWKAGKPCSGKRRCQMQTLWELNVSLHSAWKSEIITAEPKERRMKGLRSWACDTAPLCGTRCRQREERRKAKLELKGSFFSPFFQERTKLKRSWKNNSSFQRH